MIYETKLKPPRLRNRVIKKDETIILISLKTSKLS